MFEMVYDEDFQNSEEFESANESETSNLITNEVTDQSSLSSYRTAEREKWRNLIAFWFLGLCNNYAYVVMLSAAHDILSRDFNKASEVLDPYHNKSYRETESNETNPRDCNTMSTGTVLLADIIPSLVIKSFAPFIPFCVHLRVGIVIGLSSLSFLVVGLATSSSLALLGVVFASASAGLGESTLLAYSSLYHEDVISTWSSGTGGAGIVGSVTYAGLTSLGLSPKQTILLLLIIPLIMAISFWNVLEHPPQSKCRFSGCCSRLFSDCLSETGGEVAPPTLVSSQRLSFDEKLRLVPSLMKYMIPLILVYFAEYFINQGLSELLYFPNEIFWISHEQQYRWYQVIYQIGVFISRSSGSCLHIRKVWVTAVCQWLNVVIFLTAAIYWWMGSIWLAFALILWEGLLGGAAYVNTFYRISRELLPSQKEFAIQLTSVSDTFGITLSGFIAIPMHNWICGMPLRSSGT